MKAGNYRGFIEKTLKIVDFLVLMCNNFCIVTGNDTAIDTGKRYKSSGTIMYKKKRSVTIQDVARAAGVSVSTVSRVLNGKVDVAEETQDRILSVIENLGYTTNLAARSMRSQKKNLIGMILPDIAYPFAMEVMKGVNKAIAEAEYDLLVYTTGDVKKRGREVAEQKYVSLLANSISDGVLVVAPVAAEYFLDAPIVSVDPVLSNPNYPVVHATNYQGSVEAMDYLLSLGHRRIAYIDGRKGLESTNRRLLGYRDALKNAGIPIEEDLIIPGDYTTDAGIVAARHLLSLTDRPTAIFASNDQTAMGVLQVAEEMGLRIPEDFSLIGFDNIPESRYLGLTTVDQFVLEMGYVATQMLIKIIEGIPLEDQTYKMQTQLVIRNSCRKIDD